MIILLLLRRMSPRARHITGWILLGLGAVVAAATPIVGVQPLLPRGRALAACGIIFLKANPKPRAPKQAAHLRALHRRPPGNVPCRLAPAASATGPLPPAVPLPIPDRRAQ